MKLYIIVLLTFIPNYSHCMCKVAKITSIDSKKEKRGIGNAHAFEITPELLEEVAELQDDESSSEETIDELTDDQSNLH